MSVPQLSGMHGSCDKTNPPDGRRNAPFLDRRGKRRGKSRRIRSPLYPLLNYISEKSTKIHFSFGNILRFLFPLGFDPDLTKESECVCPDLTSAAEIKKRHPGFGMTLFETIGTISRVLS